jgi:hypothetical protein
MGDDLVLSSMTRRGAVVLGLILTRAQIVSGWGRKGHGVMAILARRCLGPEIAARVQKLLGPETLEEASFWADECRRNHPESGRWHYMSILLAETHIHGVPHRGCVVPEIEDFPAILGDPIFDRAPRQRHLNSSCISLATCTSRSMTRTTAMREGI